jgi:hypothetical protein
MKHATQARILATLALGGAATAGAMTAAHADAAAPSFSLSKLGAIKLYPFAGSHLDVLSNELDTNVSGIPVSTDPVNQYFETGMPLQSVPVVGSLFSAPAPAASAAPAAATDASN